MANERMSSAWLVTLSLGLAIVTFVVGLAVAIVFDVPAKFLFVGLAVVHALESWGVPITNRPAFPVSFLVWWLAILALLVGFRSLRAKQSAA